MGTQFREEPANNFRGMIYAEGHALNEETTGLNMKLPGKKPCKCGAYTHQRTTHISCPLNKK